MASVGIVTVSEKGQIVLPKKLREELKINRGSKLMMVEKKGTVTLTKLEPLLEEGLPTMLASEKSLAKDWLSKEEEKAWKNL